jgi:hypothetical protein
MDFDKFQINTKDIKISSSEESISKTIEELLHLNKRLSKRWNDEKEIDKTTNKQFEESKHYEGKGNRGEQTDPYQKQLDKKRMNKEYPVQEEQFSEKGTDGGHRPEMWDKDKEKVRGHKNVQPIWHEVYRIEDDKKSKPMKKRIKE